jgi:dienelactone hydrolase
VVSIAGEPLPGTQRLEIEGDLADQMVSGIDRFLLRETQESIAKRGRFWKRDVSSPQTYHDSVTANRTRLAKIIGAQDKRADVTDLELLQSSSEPPVVGAADSFSVLAVRWPVIRGVHGEGLLLYPDSSDTPLVANVVLIPDADQTPEQLAGIAPGLPPAQQLARRLVESGCVVIVPAVIDRRDELSSIGDRKTNQPHREFLYRPAFEMGRHIIGYEVQTALAAVDWFAHQAKMRKGAVNYVSENPDAWNTPRPIGVAGYGEGGLVALYASALDSRIDAALVSGYFASRQDLWREPIYRNVFGLLEQFGDAELASLVMPRALVIEACQVPEVADPPVAREGRNSSAAPGLLTTPDPANVQAELERAHSLTDGLDLKHPPRLIVSEQGVGPFFSDEARQAFLAALAPSAKQAASGSPPHLVRKDSTPEARHKRLFDAINSDTQRLLRESEQVRSDFMSKADRASRDPARFSASTEQYRTHFYDEVIGRFAAEPLPANPRSRQVYDETLYQGYEVVLDVFPDVFAFGILLLPKGIQPGERRPVVVCQHGLEGRPTDVADPNKNNPAYNQYACRLAERGFIVFAPQNPYIFTDRFRSLQRKANPLGKTLFSIIVPQHQQIVDWLGSLPMVDPDRIAFYGLSYGGKTAMRVPALVPKYCLSICSADFNDWIWKNASTDSPYSYVATGEYEIFEFDLGNTYNYAEMAALIAPRPFMVERGHHDGVAPDTRVAYEYAKIRQLYATLMIPERTEIEFFDGPHTIHGVGTFAFLHRHLRWPQQLNR